MKRTRPIIVILSFLFSISPTWGQQSYIQTDSLYIDLPVIDQGAVKNAQECYVDYGHEKVRYSPDELVGYGLDNGATYVSKTIQLEGFTRKVFLETLESGDYSLYRYQSKNGKHLFVAYGGDTLVSELLKKTYRKQLKEWSYIDRPGLKNDVNLVGYNKRSLKKFVKKYNQKDLSPFPSPKVGLMVGNEPAKLKLRDIKSINFDSYESSFMLGAFLDYPILLSDFSIHLEIYYSNHSYSYRRITENEYLMLKVAAPDMKVPLLFRYTLPFRKFRPFVNVGGIYAYKFNPSVLYVYYHKSGFMGNQAVKTKHHYGYSAGGGLEYKLNYKNSLFLDFRYGELYEFPPGNGFDYSCMQLSLGFNF